ncbi:MAG: acyl-CoA synthetase (AMP-forming)/AMP-acid ligase [Deltaproteobacteria bacterium]|nr:acyl-CoA synthetase (AMP-forming)/AMP-acid ligase [Deltaproteobacteria bacterium]
MDKPWYKSYAKGVPFRIDYEPTSMPQALTRTVKKFPEKTALVFIDSKISYRQLNEMANRFANFLLDMGVKPGDKVAMLMPNMPQLVAATYGAWKAGAVVVMNNPLYTDKELEYQFNNSESSILVAIDLICPRMIALQPKTKIKKIVVAHIRDHLKFPKKQLLPIVAKDKHRAIPPTVNVHEWEDILKKYPATDPNLAVPFESLACLQYTGGTTGVSKGVMLSHANLSKNVQQIVAWFPGFNQGEITHLAVHEHLHLDGVDGRLDPQAGASGHFGGRAQIQGELLPGRAHHVCRRFESPQSGPIQFDLHQGLLLRRGPPSRRGHKRLRSQDRIPDLRGLRAFGNNAGRHHEPIWGENQTGVYRAPDAGHGSENCGSVGRDKGNARGRSRRGSHQGAAGHERVLQDAR